MRYLSWGTFIVLSVAILGAGCQSVREAAVERAIERGIERNTDRNVNVDVDGDGSQFQMNDSESGQSISAGEDVSFPSDYPSDVPQYRNGMAKMVSVNPEEGHAGYVMQTNDDAATVIAWFKTEAERLGWKQKSSFDAEETTMIAWEREEGSEVTYSLNVSVSKDEENGWSIIVGRSK